MSPPRLRFAPSPTGFFHVGSGRTALWNWLIARQQGGQFVLRIEDTDLERNREEWVDGIRVAMRWLGLDWDEEYRQSQRTAKYGDAMLRLHADGHAYYCDCTRADVDARNVAAFGPGAENRGYDRHCRARGLKPGPGRPLRFATPRDGATIVHDVIRGEPSFDHGEIEDFVIARGDGSAMFILANVVDDIAMGITHVVRGEEHLSNTPKGILLWQALAPDVALPVWAHVPVLVNAQRKKLSKRRDKVALEDYRAMGILPDAMRNYLVLLGWSPGGDREILTVDEMTELFRLEAVVTSPAFFDMVKLAHMNGEYLRALSIEEFVEVATPYLPAGASAQVDVFPKMAPFVQERLRLLTDLPNQVDFLYNDPYAWEDAIASCKAPVEMLDGVLAELAAFPGATGTEVFAQARTATAIGTAYGPTVMVDPTPYVAAERTTAGWSAAEIRVAVETVGAANGLKLAKAQGAVRVAITGRSVGPPLFEAMEVLGRAECERRLRLARARLGTS